MCFKEVDVVGGRGEYTLYIISIKLSQLVSFNQFSETIFSSSFLFYNGDFNSGIYPLEY